MKRLIWSRACTFVALAVVLVSAGAGSASTAVVGAAQTEAYRQTQVWRLTDNQTSVPTFGQAEGLDVARDGTIYVVDRARRVVVRVTAGGTLGATWATSTVVGIPLDVAVTAGRLYVVGASGGEVRSLDGAVIRSWGQTGTTGVAATSAGAVYVARTEHSSGQDRAVIDVLDADGNLVTTWWPDLAIGRSAGIATSADSQVYLAADGAVYVIRDARVIGVLRVHEPFEGPLLTDVVVDREGRVYAVMGDGRVVHWHADGSPHVAVPMPIDEARHLASDYSGGLVVSRGASGLARVTDRASMDNLALLAPLRTLARVAATDTGELYVADALGHVQRWASDGIVQDAWSDHRHLVPSEDDPAHDVDWHENLGFDIAATGDTGCLVYGKGVTCLARGPAAAWQASVDNGGWLSAGSASASTLALVDFPGQVLSLYGAGGTRQQSWPLAGVDAFASVSDVALYGDLVYLADRGSQRVAIRRLDGREVGGISIPGGARRLAAADAAVYVLSRQDIWARKYDTSGALVAAWPAAPDGVAVDLAATAAGRVYVADSKAGQVLVYEPYDGTGDPPPALRDSCRVVVDKRVAPPSVYVGEPVSVRLTVSGDCPDSSDSQADIVLILDRSSFMGYTAWLSPMHGAPIVSAQAAAMAFLGELDPEGSRVAVIAMGTSAAVVQPLTASIGDVSNAIARLVTLTGGLNIANALDLAALELAGPAARPDVPHVVVMLTATISPSQPALEAAARLKQGGARVYTVGLGAHVNADLLRGVASAPEDFYEAPGPADLGNIFGAIARRVTSSGFLETATVRDELPEDMALDEASVTPLATLSGRTLTWRLTSVPQSGQDLSYRVAPRRSGLRPTNVSAELVYTDVMRYSGRALFPVPRVNVAARTPPVLHIPLALREKQICDKKRADVVLVFDVSTSMTAATAPGRTQTKLDAALTAGQVFVDLMSLPGDQLSVVSFSDRALVVLPLSGSWAEAAAALSRVRTGPPGTRIDLGLNAAGTELIGARHIPANGSVIVLLTDGQPSGGTKNAAVEQGRAILLGGITIFAVGLGEGADADLLAEIVGSSSRVFMAPDASQLSAIYRQISGMVVCPSR